MKRKTLKRIEYLENSLIRWLSLAEEHKGSLNNNEVQNNTGLRDIVSNFLLVLFLFILFLLQLPFLIIVNLIIAVNAIRNGIPFEAIPIMLPAKQIDLIENKIKIEIRYKEHAPPHYHAIIDDSDYSIDISTGEFLNGEIKNKKQKKALKEWHIKNQNLLKKIWDETRPSDCPVGKIK